ncbi:MAG: DUF3996 domain-containing protein [Balneolales bacterium]
MKYIKAAVELFIVMMLLLPLTAEEAKSQSRDSNFGLGVVVGEPTGIAGKLWVNDLNAFAGTAAWSFQGHTTLHLHLDYLHHNYDHINVNRGSMAFYYGLGGRLLARGENRDDRFGIRIPFGLAYFFSDDPVEIFLELAPILDVVPTTEFTGNSGLGVRYYF